MNAAAFVSRVTEAIALRVGGLAPLSTCDWPGELVATVFCQGCGWDCAYCHNPHLRPAQAEELLTWKSVHAFLQSRRGLLDAVVFSGGEPTLQAALSDAIDTARSLGFRIGLHTAGMYPERFAAVLPKIDWVGFDVKAPLAAYARITGANESAAQALASLRMLLDSGISYEVRTTYLPALLSVAEMVALRDELLALGVTHYAVQSFRPTGARMDRLPQFAAQTQAVLPDSYGDNFISFCVR